MSKFCTNCGNQLGEGVKFCSDCGQAVTSEQTPLSSNGQQISTYTVPGMKTQFNQGETIIVKQTATNFNRMPRISGTMILTNQRLLWEKNGLMNVVGLGLLSLAGDKYMCVPLDEITSIKTITILGASGLEFSNKSGITYKFSLNGLKHKQSRETIIDYVNKHI